eukprot:3545661-Prymnesium_polylepis.1
MLGCTRPLRAAGHALCHVPHRTPRSEMRFEIPGTSACICEFMPPGGISYVSWDSCTTDHGGRGRSSKEEAASVVVTQNRPHE